MGQCLNCKKEIEEYTGRRPKKFCSAACRQKHFQANKKKKPATVKKEGKQNEASDTAGMSKAEILRYHRAKNANQ